MVHGKRRRTLWARITEPLQLAVLHLDAIRIGLEFAAQRSENVAAYAAYYRARVPGLKLRPNHVNGDLMWTALCPVCRIVPLWVAPRDGRWVCSGACSGPRGKLPEELEYLLHGEDCKATVQRLMGQAV